MAGAGRSCHNAPLTFCLCYNYLVTWLNNDLRFTLNNILSCLLNPWIISVPINNITCGSSLVSSRIRCVSRSSPQEPETECNVFIINGLMSVWHCTTTRTLCTNYKRQPSKWDSVHKSIIKNNEWSLKKPGQVCVFLYTLWELHLTSCVSHTAVSPLANWEQLFISICIYILMFSSVNDIL